MQNRIEKGVQIFLDGHLCSQAVLGAFCKDFDLDKDLAFKLSQGFGAGISRNAQVCGAVSGAIMVLGLNYGADTQANQESKMQCYEKVNKFLSEFEKKNKALTCKELLGYHLGDEKEYAKAKQSSCFTTICPNLVKSSLEILEKIMK